MYKRPNIDVCDVCGAHTRLRAGRWTREAEASHHMQDGPLPYRLHELPRGAANLTRSNGGWLSRMPSAFDQHATLHTCLRLVKKKRIEFVCTYLCVCVCVFQCTKMKKSCSLFYVCDIKKIAHTASI